VIDPVIDVIRISCSGIIASAASSMALGVAGRTVDAVGRVGLSMVF